MTECNIYSEILGNFSNQSKQEDKKKEKFFANDDDDNLDGHKLIDCKSTNRKNKTQAVQQNFSDDVAQV
ncbi:hypothetical protein DERP_012617 [Dermatophagoides pteronyssinus]|uniref:Uncharacterized protein n=1 Tax=Dermatophagoides pteronyssinus TaxID=6956 RepID=A0ABQ8IYD3_DERPT|nr:hypothetical protein DERP_012617 [Dermatophagoides pteronyssinus]